MKTCVLLLTAIALFALSPFSIAEDVYINGGTHTFNDATYENDWIHVGIDEPGFVGFSCSGRIGWLSLYNSSMLHMSCGEVVHQLIADDSFIDFYGGTVGGSLLAKNYAKIAMSGGTVMGNLEVRQNGFIELYGTNFFVASDLYGIRTPLSPGDKLSDFGALVSEPGQAPYYKGIVVGTLPNGTFIIEAKKQGIEFSQQQIALSGQVVSPLEIRALA